MNDRCFVYKWFNKVTLMWYIGSHYSKDAHPDDGYICTSPEVKSLILSNPEDWVRTILELGYSKEMRDLEYEILDCLDAAKDPRSYNKHNGCPNFYGRPWTVEHKINNAIAKTGLKRGTQSVEHRAKISSGNKGKIISKETRDKISKSQIGRIISDDTRIKISIAHKGKIISQEYKDKISNTLKGNKLSEERKNKISATLTGKKLPVITCPHCGISGAGPSMRRFHFNNCKKRILNV